MWLESDDEFIWPLCAGREQDHIRVWKTPGRSGWFGELVVDGNYIDVTRVGPFHDAAEAREKAHACVRSFLTDLARGL